MRASASAVIFNLSCACADFGMGAAIHQGGCPDDTSAGSGSIAREDEPDGLPRLHIDRIALVVYLDTVLDAHNGERSLAIHPGFVANIHTDLDKIVLIHFVVIGYQETADIQTSAGTLW